jgi:hypothetical protein
MGLAIVENATPKSGADRDHDHHSLQPDSGAQLHFRETCGVSIVEHDKGKPGRFFKRGVNLCVSPGLIDIACRFGCAVDDDCGETAAHGTRIAKLGHELLYRGSDIFGC